MQKLTQFLYRHHCGLKFSIKMCGSVFLIALLLSSCATPPRALPFVYRGDGEFVTHGYFSGKDQYVLKLGRVDDRPNGTEITYNVGTLPRVDLVLGFESPVGFNQSPVGTASNRSVVHMQLLDAKTGDLIIDATGSLVEWNWGKSSDESDISGYGPNIINSSNNPEFRELTRFKPKRSQKFTLIFEMIERDPNGSELYLKISGGGFL